jgi:hypothetical protein
MIETIKQDGLVIRRYHFSSGHIDVTHCESGVFPDGKRRNIVVTGKPVTFLRLGGTQLWIDMFKFRSNYIEFFHFTEFTAEKIWSKVLI